MGCNVCRRHRGESSVLKVQDCSLALFHRFGTRHKTSGKHLARAEFASSWPTDYVIKRNQTHSLSRASNFNLVDRLHYLRMMMMMMINRGRGSLVGT